MHILTFRLTFSHDVAGHRFNLLASNAKRISMDVFDDHESVSISALRYIQFLQRYRL